MFVLKEYIEQVVTELKRDHEFIKTLKKAKVRQQFTAASVERMVDEWVSLHAKFHLNPKEVRLAQRLAFEKFPELYEKFRGEVGLAKKSLFITLSTFFKNRIAK